MAALLCFRSLKATLVAAASTSTLFAAANWDLATSMQSVNPGSFLDRIFSFALFAFTMPLMPLLYSVTNAMKVWAVKSSLRRVEICEDHGSIGIITLCRTFIIFPAAALDLGATSDDALGKHLGRYRRVAEDFQEFEDNCAVELRAGPRCRVTINTDAAHNDDDGALPQDSATQMICLELPDTFIDGDEEPLEERAALLRLRLAPNYKELRFLRSRNKFQTVVTGLQAIGYLITVVQRLAQHLSISPIEAITAFLCIVVGLQLLIELYACSHYQRPLVIHLSTHQFRCFRDAPRDKIDLQWKYLLILSSPVWVLILSLAMYYFIHYVHACLLCSLSALFFFLAQAIFVSGFCLAMIWFGFSSDILAFLLLVGGLLYACSIILAVISTTIKWKAFHQTNHHNWFAWLFPHVSG